MELGVTQESVREIQGRENFTTVTVPRWISLSIGVVSSPHLVDLLCEHLGEIWWKFPISERHTGCLTPWLFTLWWTLSHLSALWVRRDRARRDQGTVDEQGDCQRYRGLWIKQGAQFWVTFELHLRAGWKEANKKTPRGKTPSVALGKHLKPHR